MNVLIQSLKLLLLLLTLATAPASATEYNGMELYDHQINATDGTTIRGTVTGHFLAQLEPGLREMGYIQYFISEEGTGRLYSFMHEDPACVLLPAILQPSGCSHSGPREVRLKHGDLVRITQHQTYLTTRMTLEVEVLSRRARRSR